MAHNMNDSAAEAYTIKTKSIKDRLSKDVRDVMDERLPGVSNTIITVMACPHCRERFSPEAQMPLVGDRTIEHRMCLYLSKVVDSENGEVSDEDISRFERLIVHLIENHMVAHGVLADPLCIPLLNGKIAIMWYVFSDYTREQLNEKLGCDCFVEEGEIYNDEWPEVVRD